MNPFTPTNLKSILHSKRANLYYLEHCRVLVNGGRVEYVTDEGNQSLYWNIPIANTTTILLGTGTSITQAAMRELAKAGVMVGFCGGGSTPLYAGTEPPIDIAWFPPQSEYRPTEYLQQWVRFWFDDALRLEAGKHLQRTRLDFISRHWSAARRRDEGDFHVDERRLAAALDAARQRLAVAPDHTALLTEEARLSKTLFKLACDATDYGDFTRAKDGTGADSANRFLDHGNYLAYGLGATAAWVLGLPHGLAVLHGKTRRGGLVFDIADLVKDALILPQAFRSASGGDSPQEFRDACIATLLQAEALDFMIDTVKAIALELGGSGQPGAGGGAA
ncbi:MAG: type I-F CRISPR-associated endonuclease Cas1f [Giesbergeria sp.]|jgi:CRISPR-associated protein Cas1|nr:type I-F CRISPR-associated endonuclease Cas1f [Giesbergeria sp.]